MARFPNLVLSKTLLGICGVRVNRAIMTSPNRLEKALESLEKNAYYEKYADKIAKLQQTSPEEFLCRVDQLERVATPKSKPDSIDGKYSQLLNPKKQLKGAGSAETPLDKIMKIELIQGKDRAEIEEIWRQYHVQKNFIAAVVPQGDYEELRGRGAEFPTFLFPLPRSHGYEFIMSQFDKNRVHFTPLLYYQVHKENAPECLTITHYTELRESKGIVLMRGEFDKNVIGLKEAQCLANQLLLYYVRPTGEKVALLKRFLQKPNEFKHMDLIAQIENLQLA